MGLVVPSGCCPAHRRTRPKAVDGTFRDTQKRPRSRNKYCLYEARDRRSCGALERGDGFEPLALVSTSPHATVMPFMAERALWTGAANGGWCAERLAGIESTRETIVEMNGMLDASVA